MPSADFRSEEVLRPFVSTVGPRDTHAVVPPRGEPTLLIPRYPAEAAAASLRSYNSSGTRLARVVKAGATLAAHFGGARALPKRIGLGGEDTFLAYLSDHFGDEAVACAIHLGPRRANRKPVLHIMTPKGASIAYVKLGINRYTAERIWHETSVLQRLGSMTIPNLVTPSLMHSGEWEGNPFLIMESITGTRRVAPRRSSRVAAVSALEQAFPRKSLRLARTPVWISSRQDLHEIPPSEESMRLERVMKEITDRYGDCVIDTGASHGDWSRWNMAASGTRVAVWDWERFALDRPVGWDELHFRLGAHPHGSARALEDESYLLTSLTQNAQTAPVHALLATYLVCRGVSRLKGKHETNVASSALQKWLLPGVERIMSRG